MKAITTISIIISAIFAGSMTLKLGLTTTVVLVILILILSAIAIGKRHKEMTREDYQQQCEHYFVGDTCRECDYTYENETNKNQI